MKYLTFICIVALTLEVEGFDICQPFLKNIQIDYKKYSIPEIKKEAVKVKTEEIEEAEEEPSVLDLPPYRFPYVEGASEGGAENGQNKPNYSVLTSLEEEVKEPAEEPEEDKSILMDTYLEYKKEAIRKIQPSNQLGILKVHKNRLEYFWRSKNIHYFNSSHSIFLNRNSLIKTTERFEETEEYTERKEESRNSNYIRIIINENRLAIIDAHTRDMQEKRIDEVILEYLSVLFFNSADSQETEELKKTFKIYEKNYKEDEEIEKTEDFIQFIGGSNFKHPNYTEYVFYFDEKYVLELENNYKTQKLINYLSEVKCFCEYIEISVDHLIVKEYSSYSKYSYRRNETIDTGSLIEVLLYLVTILPKRISVTYMKEIAEKTNKIHSLKIDRKSQMWAAYRKEGVERSFGELEINGFRSGSVCEWIGFVRSLDVKKIGKFLLKDQSIISPDFIECISEEIELEEIGLEDCDITDQIEDMKNRLRKADIRKITLNPENNRKQHKLSFRYSENNSLLCNEQVASFFISLAQRIDEITGSPPDIMICDNSIRKIGDLEYKESESHFRCNNLELHFGYRGCKKSISKYSNRLVYYLLNRTRLRPDAERIEIILEKVPGEEDTNAVDQKEFGEIINELGFYLPVVFDLPDKISVKVVEKKEQNSEIFYLGKRLPRAEIDIGKNNRIIQILQKYVRGMFRDAKKVLNKLTDESARSYTEFIKEHKKEVEKEEILEEIKILKDEMVEALFPFFIFHKKNRRTIFKKIEQVDNYVCKVIETRWNIKDTISGKEGSSHKLWVLYVSSIMKKYAEHFREIQKFLLKLREEIDKVPGLPEGPDTFSVEKFVVEKNITEEKIEIEELLKNYILLKSSIQIEKIRNPIKSLIEKSNINQKFTVIKNSDALFLQLSKTSKFLFSAIEVVVNSIRLPGLEEIVKGPTAIGS